MSDDKPPSRSGKVYPVESTMPKKGWFERISDLFQDTPQDSDSLIEILKTAEQDNILNSELLSMMVGVMRIADLHARDIMIARPQMVVVDENMNFKEMLQIVVDSGHSRFPVIGDNRDDIEGILLAKDLLWFTAQNATGDEQKFNLKDFLRPAVIVPESKRIDTLLREFRTNRNHMAIVVDEYGSVAGLVTIEDVLEQIVGEIEDEYDIDGEEETIQTLGENEFVVKGHTEIEEFNEYFKSSLDDEEFDTINGLLMQAFGRVPEKDDSVILDDFKFEVVNSDTRRIKLARVQRMMSNAE